MVIDLNALLRGEKASVEIDAEFTPSAPDGITLLPGAHLHGAVTDTGGYIRMEATASVPYRGECARCLDPVEGVLKFEFNRTLVTEGTLSAERLEEDADEYLELHSGVLDADAALSESVFLEFPMLLLCRDDCRGLCPHCGKRLTSDSVCSCTKPEIDSRWAKLAEIKWDEQ